MLLLHTLCGYIVASSRCFVGVSFGCRGEREGPKAAPVQNGGLWGGTRMAKQCPYKLVALEWHMGGRWVLLLFLSTLCGWLHGRTFPAFGRGEGPKQ